MYMFYRVYQDGSNKNVSSTGSMSSGKLVVDSIMYENVSHYRAEYKCIASNTRGKKDGSATFNVLGK